MTIAEGGPDTWEASGNKASSGIGEGGKSTWLVNEDDRAAELKKEQNLMWKKLQSQQKTEKQPPAEPKSSSKKRTDFSFMIYVKALLFYVI